jgi:hypothetical protein
MLSSGPVDRLFLAAGTLATLACASSPPPAPAKGPVRPCAKVDTEIANHLAVAKREDLLGVVVEVSRVPRTQDLLWAGFAGCLGTPQIEPWSSMTPWGEREIGPSSLPVMCVGWASPRQIIAWCDDPVVGSVEAWH